MLFIITDIAEQRTEQTAIDLKADGCYMPFISNIFNIKAIFV